MKKSILSFGAAILAATALAACGSGSSDQESANGPAMELPTMYKQNCISCHGNELQGRVGPNLQKVGARMSEEELTTLIQNGKGGMPAYAARLTPDDIASLASWLSEQK